MKAKARILTWAVLTLSFIGLPGVADEPWARVTRALTGDVDRSRLRQSKRAEAKPMGHHIWVSANGDWSDTASWDDGVVPITNDTVAFTGHSQVSVTRGLDQTGVLLDELRIDPEYKGDIGQPGAGLTIHTDKLTHRGSGRVFLTGTGAGVAEIICDSPNLVDALTLQGTASPWYLYIKGGKVLCGSQMTNNINHLTLAPGENRALVEVAATSGSHKLNKVYVHGGELVNYRPINLSTSCVEVGAGRFVHEAGSVTLWVQHGGLGVLNASGGPSVTEMYIYGGTVDTTRTGGSKSILSGAIGPFGDLVKSNQLTASLLDLREPYP